MDKIVKTMNTWQKMKSKNIRNIYRKHSFTFKGKLKIDRRTNFKKDIVTEGPNSTSKRTNIQEDKLTKEQTQNQKQSKVDSHKVPLPGMLLCCCDSFHLLLLTRIVGKSGWVRVKLGTTSCETLFAETSVRGERRYVHDFVPRSQVSLKKRFGMTREEVERDMQVRNGLKAPGPCYNQNKR